MELTKKCVLVFGTGISGIGAAHLLLAKGAEVILYDGNTEKDKDALLAEFPAGSQAVRLPSSAFLWRILTLPVQY